MTSEAATEKKLRRPRGGKRRLNTPVNLALSAILIAVVAFWLGGKLNSSDSSVSMPAGLPSFTGGDTDASTSGFPGMGGGGDSTQGEITSLSGKTIYVETSNGTTVKVRLGANATVTRTSEVAAGELHPGDTVSVSGKTSNSGTVKATEVTATQSGVQATMPSFGGAPPSGSATADSSG